MNEIEGAIVQFPKLLKQKTESITALALKNLRENMLNAFQNEMQNQLIDMETVSFNNSQAKHRLRRTNQARSTHCSIGTGLI
mmetsp:Transcript_37671/g.60452  ORF Transcript_37671/g.60452 Transcript_37671/m.60452 type:complete len:82 (+) Transcript_37671:978-1223(+)